jgi:selenocysteine lyase/cysteine desulfurase
VHPVAEAGAIIRAHGDAIYLLDACQAIGQLPVDVRTIGCDVLTGTGRKFLRGPRGTGVLYVARHLIDRIDPPGIDGHSAVWSSTSTYELASTAERMETFEVSYATKVGLGVAVDYALSWGISDIAERIGLLADRLRSSLTGAGYQVLDGPLASSGIVTFRAPTETASDLKRRLQARSINTSVVRTPSARYDMEPLGLTEIVRASVHYYNTVDELDATIEALGPAR